MPYCFSAAPERDLLPSAGLGEHTTEILRSVARLSHREIQELIEAKGVSARADA